MNLFKLISNIILLIIVLSSCTNNYVVLKRQNQYQLSIEEDYLNSLDIYYSKYKNLKEEINDKTIPQKVEFVKKQLALLDDFHSKIYPVYELIENYKLKILKQNGENIKHLFSKNYDKSNPYEIPKINLLLLKNIEFSNGINLNTLKKDIKLILNKSNFPIGKIKKGVYLKYLNKLNINDLNVPETINQLSLLEIETVKLMSQYMNLIYLPFEIFYNDLLSVEIVYDAPTVVKNGDSCKVKLYLAGIDTINKPKIYWGNNLVTEFKKNAGILRVKAKADSLNFQILKGKVKFINEYGEARCFYWRKKIEIVE